MRQVSFKVTQIFRSEDEQTRKKQLKIIVESYLKSRLESCFDTSPSLAAEAAEEVKPPLPA